MDFYESFNEKRSSLKTLHSSQPNKYEGCREKILEYLVVKVERKERWKEKSARPQEIADVGPFTI